MGPFQLLVPYYTDKKMIKLILRHFFWTFTPVTERHNSQTVQTRCQPALYVGATSSICSEMQCGRIALATISWQNKSAPSISQLGSHPIGLICG